MISLRTLGDILRKTSVYCPKCGAAMRRTSPGKDAWWACSSSECDGTRGKQSSYVESRDSWQEEYGDYQRREAEILLKFGLVEETTSLDAKPLSILDYGCAYGHYLQYLKEKNPNHKLYGIDIANHAVQAVKEKAIAEDVFWQHCDQALPFDDSTLDIVYSFDTIEHIPIPEALDFWFDEVRRVLKPDGRLYLFIPNFHLHNKIFMLISGEYRNMLGGDHCFMLTSADVNAWLGGRFRILQHRFVSPVTNHRGFRIPCPLLYSPTLKISENIFWAAAPKKE
jgi:SAM-dependent methyltransferase